MPDGPVPGNATGLSPEGVTLLNVALWSTTRPDTVAIFVIFAVGE